MSPRTRPVSIRMLAPLLIAASAPLASARYVQQLEAHRFVCANSVTDQSHPMDCMTASKEPVLGSLYPLSEDWFVSSLGDAGKRDVGIGTTDLDARLTVHGRFRTPLTGTVCIAEGSTTLIGTGTLFNNEMIGTGTALLIGNEEFTIRRMESDTLLHVADAAILSHCDLPAFHDGKLLAVENAAGTEVFAIDAHSFYVPHKDLYLGDPLDPAPPPRTFVLSKSDGVGLYVRHIEDVANLPLAETLFSFLERGNNLEAGDRNQIALGFHAIDNGGYRPFFTAIQAVVENPFNSTKSAGLGFLTCSTGNVFPSERMRITGDGNVGIGTSTPDEKLHVVGNLHVTGSITKGSGTFKIDHPLDPENKYLSHSFVESPDMMNVYNGNAVLDADGAAWIELPDWFEALNRDFRYQLSCIGAFAPVYVAEKIHGNRFRIAGGQRGLEVSWQVTGIRHDRFANAHRVVVEEEKPASARGTYLHPELFVDATTGRGVQDPSRSSE